LSYYCFGSVFNPGIFCHAGPNCHLLSLRAGPARQSAISTWHHEPCHSPPDRHGATRPCLKGCPDSAGPKPTTPPPLSEAARRLIVRPPPDRACPSATPPHCSTALRCSTGKVTAPHPDLSTFTVSSSPEPATSAHPFLPHRSPPVPPSLSSTSLVVTPSPTCSSVECHRRGFGPLQAGLCTSSPCAARHRLHRHVAGAMHRATMAGVAAVDAQARAAVRGRGPHAHAEHGSCLHCTVGPRPGNRPTGLISFFPIF
jgi:hypothetical protein